MSNFPIRDLLPEVAQIVRKAPDGTLIRAYARAVRAFCTQTRWYRSTLEGQLEPNVILYNLGSDPHLEILGIKAMQAAQLTGNTQPWPLRVQNDTGLWTPQQNASTPQQYAYVPEGQVSVWPTPNAVFPVTITLVLQPRRGVTEIPEELLTKWEYAFQAGALEYLLSIPSQPWTDLAESKRQGLTYRAGINNAKADEQRGYNAGTVFMRRRPFIVGR